MFKEKLIHLDLKGAPPKVEYLKAAFPLMKQWGATGLCIEWEDTLPFEGELEVIRLPYCYSREDVQEILSAAKDAGLSVVPLVQTFGHLEFVLMHRKFANLREKATFLMDLCPCRREALPLIKSLVDQVISFHPDIEAIHLGGDEVWSLGTCEKCLPIVEKEGKAALFLKHMTPLLEHVKGKGLRSLIWDDMMRKWPEDELKPVSELVEPVVWKYGEDIEAGLPEGMWERFEAAFPKIWGASCFKGAGGADIIWPDYSKRAANHQSWLTRSEKTDLEGLILTGWSRYNHTAALCEMLPVGMPSLKLCLSILEKGGFTDALRRETFEGLGLGDMPFMHRTTDEIVSIPKGDFPGADIFRLTGKLQGARALVEGARHTVRIHFPRYNGGRRDPHRWAEVADRAHRAAEIAEEVEKELPGPLGEALFQQDVDEFMEAKVKALREEALDMVKEAEALLAGEG